MTKIICEICGTVYPDTAEACPICGYPRENSKAVTDDDTVTGKADAAVDSSAPRPKGGRYYVKNVKKRNQAAAAGRDSRKNQEPEAEQPEANRGLIITVIVLLIGIVLVTMYIGWRFFKGRDAYDHPSMPTTPSTTQTSQPEDPQPSETGIPCTGLTISDSTITFSEAGKAWKLTISKTPEDTTEELVVTSSDENVVTVTSDGILTAVGPGTATITISCGDFARVCVVNCTFTEETTEPVETTQPEETTKPTETTEPEEKGLVLSHTDVTLFAEGESFRITVKYNGETVSPAQISWSTKDDTIATVESNGKVTAVGAGNTTITVTYNGETAKCIVRCDIETEQDDETEPTEQPDETEETEPADPVWQISHSDVTLRVGESFRLRIFNEAGDTAEVEWSVSESGIVSVDGNKITGEADGRVRLTATVDGQTFTCIVRVKA